MRAKKIDHSSFAFLALCFCQACTITSSTSTLHLYSNEHLVAGAASALEGDWKQAARIWNQLANSGTDRVCGKAAFNMVIACEMLDRRDLAIQWARKTISNYESTAARKRASNYLRFVNEPYEFDDIQGEALRTN
ncbi:MAG: hypothetical protein JKX73_00605 [Flavobacteriales bacterium]|nr:hypothetical protein [Flavobacteriales bacterium]